ncbi:hypothetical protein L2E82_39354 [Cichorium intybus]|uniref:Uncharacterized protein n=1 Tax=Cichorium intybus TaxID=13427 RepID=A0ACB9AIB5_CICIN|nr:hypothetical protein L2E82_39354 [Cichorium intybus]
MEVLRATISKPNTRGDVVDCNGDIHDVDLHLNSKGLRLKHEEKGSCLLETKEIDLRFSLKDLETIEVIEKGSGGVVQLVRHKWIETLFALKVGIL